jgi:hypothetical protein
MIDNIIAPTQLGAAAPLQFPIARVTLLALLSVL